MRLGLHKSSTQHLEIRVQGQVPAGNLHIPSAKIPSPNGVLSFGNGHLTSAPSVSSKVGLVL